MIRLKTALIAAMTILILAVPAWAEPGKGPVMLTIIGKIDKPNRPKSDAFFDGFFASQDTTFKNARAFDTAALDALGVKTMTVKYPKWPKAITFEGPLLADVLDAAGARGDKLIIRALDGYAIEMSASEVRKAGIILANKRDGAYLGIGGRGPTWVVMPTAGDKKPKDDSKLIWAVYVIEVR